MQSINKNEENTIDIPTLFVQMENRFSGLLVMDKLNYSFASHYVATCGKDVILNLIINVQETLSYANQLFMEEGCDKNDLKKKILYMQLWLTNMKYYCGDPYKKVDVFMGFLKVITYLDDLQEIPQLFLDKPLYLQLTKLSALEILGHNSLNTAQSLVYFADLGNKPKVDKNADTWCIYWCRMHLYFLAFKLAVRNNSDRNLIDELGKKAFDFYTQIVSIYPSSEDPDNPDQLLWYGMIKMEAGLFFPIYHIKEGHLDFIEENKEKFKKYSKLIYESHKNHILFAVKIIENSASSNALYIKLFNQTLALIHQNQEYLMKVRIYFKEDKSFKELLEKRIYEFIDTMYQLSNVALKKSPRIEIQYQTIDEVKKKFDIEMGTERADKYRLKFEKSLETEARNKADFGAKKAKNTPKKSQKNSPETIKPVLEDPVEELPKPVVKTAPVKPISRPVELPKPVVKTAPVKPIARPVEPPKPVVKATPVKPIARPVELKPIQKKPAPQPSLQRSQKAVIPTKTPERVISMEPTNPWKKPVTSTKPALTLFQPENITPKIEYPIYEFASYIEAQKRLEAHLDRLNWFISQQLQYQDFLYHQDVNQFADILQKIQEEADYKILCDAYYFFNMEIQKFPANPALPSHCLNIQTILSAVHLKIQYLESSLPILQAMIDIKKSKPVVPDEMLFTTQNTNTALLIKCLADFHTTRNTINLALEKADIRQVCVSLPLDIRYLFDLLGKASQICYLVGSSSAGLVISSDIAGKDRDFVLLDANIMELMHLGFVKNTQFKELTIYSALIKLPDDSCVPVDALLLDSKNWLPNDLERRNFNIRVYCNELGIISDFAGGSFRAIREKKLDMPDDDPVQRLQKNPEILLQIADKLLDNYTFPDRVLLAVQNWTQGADYSSYTGYIHAVAKKYTTKWGAEIYTAKLLELNLLERMFPVTHENLEKSTAALMALIEKPSPRLRMSLFRPETAPLSGDERVETLGPTS